MIENMTIRKLESVEEVRLIQKLERDVWGMDPIPIHQTYTAVTNGGLLLGAFYGEKIVGFSYSFAGFKGGKAYLCSHMLGIHPDYQRRGIGKLLKLRQMEEAKAIGYELITWTFDPLESQNAYLNLTKLKGISNLYLANWYGEMKDGLNKGLPTDRLKIEWWISSERVENEWEPNLLHYQQPFTVCESDQGSPKISYDVKDIPVHCEGIEVPIPKDFQTIKKKEPTLALAWRLSVRKIFQLLFSAGYAVVGLRRANEEVYYYQLIKRESIPLKSTERGDM